MRRRTTRQPEKPAGKFGGVLDEGHLNAFRGKRVAIFVDDCDHEIEAELLKFTVFEKLGVEGRVVGYSELFSGGSVKADFILLRSTREFAYDMEGLKTALERLRGDNPEAVIIVTAFDPSVFRFAAPFAASGLVDVLDDSIVSNDLRTIVGAVKVRTEGEK